LWELQDHALIYQERAIPEVEYAFQHMLTQETVYQSILRRRRAALHQQVAEAMEVLYRDVLEEYHEQIAHHYERSGNAEKAVESLLTAGDKAKRAFLNEAAIGYLQRAAAHLSRWSPDDPGAERRRGLLVQVYEQLGDVHLLAGHPDGAALAYAHARRQ